MDIKTPFLALLLVIGSASANAQGKEDPGAGEPTEPTDVGIDHILLSSLVSKSEMVILGDLKAISSIRRVADRIAPGPWILTQYSVKVEDTILSSTNPVPDSISLVSYGGDLVLPGKLDSGNTNGPIALDPNPSDPAGTKAVFQRFGGSETLTHSPRIAQTGKYVIFVQTTRQRHLFEGLRLLAAYKVKKVNGIEYVEMASRSGTKAIVIDYNDLTSELSTHADSLNTFEPANNSNGGQLHVDR